MRIEFRRHICRAAAERAFWSYADRTRSGCGRRIIFPIHWRGRTESVRAGRAGKRSRRRMRLAQIVARIKSNDCNRIFPYARRIENERVDHFRFCRPRGAI
jgi:hypothetical protein